LQLKVHFVIILLQHSLTYSIKAINSQSHILRHNETTVVIGETDVIIGILLSDWLNVNASQNVRQHVAERENTVTLQQSKLKRYKRYATVRI